MLEVPKAFKILMPRKSPGQLSQKKTLTVRVELRDGGSVSFQGSQVIPVWARFLFNWKQNDYWKMVPLNCEEFSFGPCGVAFKPQEWPLYSKVVMLLVSTPSGQFNLSVVLPLPPKLLSALSTLNSRHPSLIQYRRGNKRQIYNLYSDPQDKSSAGLSKLAHKVGCRLVAMEQASPRETLSP